MSASRPRYVFFDFDRTLASKMVYEELGGHRAEEAGQLFDNAKSQNHDFWRQAFGGAHRVGRLRWMLKSLRDAGVRIYICSFNDDDVVALALSRVNLIEHFRNKSGQPRILARRLGDKAARISGALSIFRAQPSSALFVDDMQENCDHVCSANSGIAIHCCGPSGLGEEDIVQVVEHFAPSSRSAQA